MSKITLKIIAKTLGISVGTVSKALKDYPDISEKTKRKVKSLVESLNYTPNSFAQSLRAQESKIVGLIIPSIVHYFFSNVINGVLNAASEKGYLVIILQTEESYENEKKQLQLLVKKNIDGILLSLSDKTVRYDHIKQVINEGIPVVLYDKTSKSVNCSKVLIDDKKAAFNATAYLIKTGCKRIAHVRGPLKPQTTIDRFMGYRKALETYNIPFDKSLVYVSEELSYENGYNLTDQIIDDHSDLDGVFAFTDLVATGVLTKLKERGVDVPNKVSVIGFSNWFLSKITSPTLSTIDQPGYEMGLKAFDLLHKEINQIKKGLPINYEVVEISTKVIPRNSTKTLWLL
jgi:LacI family transcriptional regulator